jgi:hypothetical protein
MTRLVNFEQSCEDRRAKYRMARMFGYSVDMATRMRDWRKTHFVKHLFLHNVRGL